MAIVRGMCGFGMVALDTEAGDAIVWGKTEGGANKNKSSERTLRELTQRQAEAFTGEGGDDHDDDDDDDGVARDP